MYSPSPASGSNPGTARTTYIPHPRAYSARGRGPTHAFFLTLFGGILFMLEGTFTILYGRFITEFSFGLLGSDTVQGGAVTAILGLLLAVMAFLVLSNPEHHRFDGAVIVFLTLVASFVSLAGGFYIGDWLAWAGGLSAFAWTPPEIGGADAVRRARAQGRSGPS